MNNLNVSVDLPTASVPPMMLRTGAPKITVRDLNFYYGQSKALKNINLTLGTNRVTAFIGPSGCGKSTLLRVFNRMYDLYPGQRAEGQVLLDKTNILDPEARPEPAARAGRHGVPEADAVSDDDLREHRLRRPPLRKDLQVGNGRPGREGACAAARCGTR